MPGYYLGIDQGTTLTTAVLVDENWHIVAKASKAHQQYYPQPGWVEHDPMEIYENCLAATAMALSQLPGATAKDILCLGLDHQGETCLIWDKDTGVPIYNAIVWQDRRTAAHSDKLKQEMGSHILQITGSLPDAYHSATKLSWLLDHVEGARARAEKGELLAGTLNTWLYWKLTGGECYQTDPSSANCMMLIDDARVTEQMALSVPDTSDVFFVPALAGFATPYWDQYARGLFIGLTAGVTREHLVRAVLESLAYQVTNCYQIMKTAFGRESQVMRADGGMVENRFLMQFQSDMLGIPVEVPEEKETAALGAAYLAGYTIGALPSIESAKKYVKLKYVYEPNMSADEREARLAVWLDAAQRSRDWAKPRKW